jgi:hypothetical protein
VLFLSDAFPYVCPEPVLAKCSFFIYKWLKNAGFRRTPRQGDVPLHAWREPHRYGGL